MSEHISGSKVEKTESWHLHPAAILGILRSQSTCQTPRYVWGHCTQSSACVRVSWYHGINKVYKATHVSTHTHAIQGYPRKPTDTRTMLTKWLSGLCIYTRLPTLAHKHAPCSLNGCLTYVSIQGYPRKPTHTCTMLTKWLSDPCIYIRLST